MNSKAKMLSALLVTLSLAACGHDSGLNGTYTDGTGLSSITFESNNKVDMTVMGITEELYYEVDGDKLKIGIKGGPMQVWTIENDGSILNPLGMKLTKKK